ncbi:polysaccharide biosynthesis protein [Methanocaldococcus infernus ME]|uniref:Polysaccharide biosynthesis protein n=1 Tax=Methanocaldococcus infernus (strain DSM 11812 / JCM 15783 / ME) TaxID=573063 RepID=D5VU50_METIM|nr:flippase [Methanocaldococcus infernus]ADG14103.1 polysaccharide biosynthesis protein [Methanocaldococcus infernus ME]
MSYKERVVKGITWNFLLLMLSAPIGYLVRVLYANELPKLDVGLFYAVLDFCCMVAIFKDLGLSAALVRFIPKFLHEKRKDLIKSTIISVGLLQTSISLIITLIIIIIAPIIAEYYINNRGQFTGHLDFVVNVLIILSIGYWFQSIMDVISRSILGFQNQKYYGTISFVRVSLILLFSLIFIFLFNIHNALSPTYAYTITPIVLIIIYGHIFIKKIFPNFFREKLIFSKSLVKDLFSYGLPLMFGSASGLILGYLDGICLTYFTGLNAVADYRNVAMPTTLVLSYLASAIHSVLFPMSSELWEKGYKRYIKLALEKISLYTFIIILPMGILTAYFSEIIVKLFFNLQYLSAVPAMRILSFGIIFMSLNRVGFTILNGIGKSFLSIKILYIGAFFNLIFNILLIPKFGTIGASIATTLSYFLMWFLLVKFIYKFLDVNYKKLIKNFVVIIIIGTLSLILLILIMKFLNNVNILLKLIFGIIIYVIIYLAGILLLKIIDFDEILEILNKLRRFK